MADSLIERLERRIDFTSSDSGCWLWTGAKISTGYGHLTINGRQVLAHRLAYELFIGPIPDGKWIDHVRARGCTSKACVNPEHLEAVDPGENTRRGDAHANLRAKTQAQTHCKRGHSLADAYVDKRGYRSCRPCMREANRRWKAAH